MSYLKGSFGPFTKAHTSLTCHLSRLVVGRVFHSTPSPGRPPSHSGHRRWKMSEPLAPYRAPQV